MKVNGPPPSRSKFLQYIGPDGIGSDEYLIVVGRAAVLQCRLHEAEKLDLSAGIHVSECGCLYLPDGMEVLPLRLRAENWIIHDFRDPHEG